MDAKEEAEVIRVLAQKRDEALKVYLGWCARVATATRNPWLLWEVELRLGMPHTPIEYEGLPTSDVGLGLPDLPEKRAIH